MINVNEFILGGGEMQSEQWVLIEDDIEYNLVWEQLDRRICFKPDYYSKDCPFTFSTPVEAYSIAGTLSLFETHDSNGFFRTTKQIETMKSIFINCLG